MAALVAKVRGRIPKHYEYYCVQELLQRLPEKMIKEHGLSPSEARAPQKPQKGPGDVWR